MSFESFISGEDDSVQHVATSNATSTTKDGKFYPLISFSSKIYERLMIYFYLECSWNMKQFKKLKKKWQGWF